MAQELIAYTKAELLEMIQKLKEDNQNLYSEISARDSLKIKNQELDSKIKELDARVKELINESFEKQRSIKELTDQKNKITNDLNQIVKEKDGKINTLTNQLNGLSDLFNELYVGFKDQMALFGVYSRNIAYFQERMDLKINKFNGTEEKGEK